MRKTPILVAVAAAFDLGVMVAGGHAAEANQDFFLKVDKAGPQGAPNSSLKIKFTDVIISSLKVGGIKSPMACMDLGGTPFSKNGQAFCHLPNAPGQTR